MWKKSGDTRTWTTFPLDPPTFPVFDTTLDFESIAPAHFSYDFLIVFTNSDSRLQDPILALCNTYLTCLYVTCLYSC